MGQVTTDLLSPKRYGLVLIGCLNTLRYALDLVSVQLQSWMPQIQNHMWLYPQLLPL